MSQAERELERAWSWREQRGIFVETEALRVFHGPGEGTEALSRYAIDRYGDHYWVSEWEGGSGEGATRSIQTFLERKSARSAVFLGRPKRGVPADPVVLIGEPPAERFVVSEGSVRAWIQLLGSKHPGLFLDHAPLRRWLLARSRGWTVLNAFAYTGSLSLACGIGGARQVTTLDLSKPTIEWAKRNWVLNELAPEKGEFIAGDVFEWLPRLKKSARRFDCVILDPPSFARGNKGTFSTAKDLPKLHELALDLLEPGGILVTSINSSNVSRAKFESEIGIAARAKKASLQILGEISQPETFPSRLGVSEDRYLKGWILRKA